MFGATIDDSGSLALGQFVGTYHPEFLVGAIDQKQFAQFGDWGMRRSLVPQLYFIDKQGIIKAQFMGTDDLFLGDQTARLRVEVIKEFRLSTAPPASPPVVKKK